MHTRHIALIVAVIAIALLGTSARTEVLLPEQAELFERALAQAGLEMSDVRIDPADLAVWGGDKYRLPLISAYMDDPWKISSYTRSQTDGLLNRQDDLATLLVSCHKQTGHAVRLGLVGDALEPYKLRAAELGEDALAVALSELTGQDPASYHDTDMHLTGYDGLPPAVRDAAAVFLFAVPDVLAYRELGLTEPVLKLGLDPQAVYTEVLDYLLNDGEEQDDALEKVLLLESLMDHVDWAALNTGATLATVAAQGLRDALTAADVDLGDGAFHFAADTPLGRVVLAGSDDDDYPADDYLLILDLAGAESYENCAANRDYHHPLSVTVDLGGLDSYFNEEQAPGAFGAGLFGYGLLIDTAGDDWYAAGSIAYGVGIFGSGLLADGAGNDAYHAKQLAQGAGIFGTGLMIDNDGDDYYIVDVYGQGYGYTMGCGLLLDGKGNDQYIGSEAGEPNGGPFGAERYIHFAQGAAYGRRDDYGTGHSWAGGVGMLVDGGGDDEYHCEVYGQGTGYWYALGILVDKGGDDYHHAGWYSLGSSPHMAVGVFQDDGGDDFYALKQMQSIGNGRDFSVGWFEDSAGNDHYQGGIMTLGVGDINGIGVFWDKAGDDVYLTKGPSLGQSRIESAGSLRDVMLTLGLFVDGGGADTYLTINDEVNPTGQRQPLIDDWSNLEPHPIAADGTCWTRETDQNQVPGAVGVGIDAE
ncbi:hypothetical protein JW859_13295 [bacterium]|nr:hypothetical protein [bacterium]